MGYTEHGVGVIICCVTVCEGYTQWVMLHTLEDNSRVLLGGTTCALISDIRTLPTSQPLLGGDKATIRWTGPLLEDRATIRG